MPQSAAEILERQGAEQLYRVIVGADPAANVELDIVVPGGVIWIVQSLVVTFVTDAAVANRNVHLTLDDGTTEYCRVLAIGTQAASLTQIYAWIRDYGTVYAAGSTRGHVAGMPSFPLLSGHHIRTVTSLRQAGDNYSAPVLYVREYQERGLAAEIAYEVAQLMRENAQLDAIETGGF